MKLMTASSIAIVAAFAFASVAVATPPNKNVEYAGGSMGSVVFDGKAHAEAGLKCGACHPGLFTMKQEAKMTMADHKQDVFCFSCHKQNGSAAAACADCHKK